MIVRSLRRHPLRLVTGLLAFLALTFALPAAATAGTGDGEGATRPYAEACSVPSGYTYVSIYSVPTSTCSAGYAYDVRPPSDGLTACSVPGLFNGAWTYDVISGNSPLCSYQGNPAPSYRLRAYTPGIWVCFVAQGRGYSSVRSSPSCSLPGSPGNSYLLI
jgi:hypothetical protein